MQATVMQMSRRAILGTPVPSDFAFVSDGELPDLCSHCVLLSERAVRVVQDEGVVRAEGHIQALLEEEVERVLLVVQEEQVV